MIAQHAMQRVVTVPRPALVAAGLAALTGLSTLLRVGALDIGYGIDEAISVGIAGHPAADIPRTLLEDGSPPLYYLLLHGWMALAGSGEAATRTLSLLFALALVPTAYYAARALFGTRAAWLAAAGAARCPFLMRYAEETRRYTLVVLLSTIACAAFVLAFVHGRRAHLVTLVVALALLLYTHTWGLFLVAGLALAWAAIQRNAKREALLVAVAVAGLYAPWIPSLVFQARHTGAPWAQAPSFAEFLAVPGQLLGVAAVPLLALVAAEGLRRRPTACGGACLLLVVAAATAATAWLWSQVEPMWTARYLAVVLGPLLLGIAGAAVHGGR
jgi:mannosyltransferase